MEEVRDVAREKWLATTTTCSYCGTVVDLAALRPEQKVCPECGAQLPLPGVQGAT